MQRSRGRIEKSMDKNRICELLQIKHPILQGGMLRLADAELAAAVSDAGALGILSPYAGMEESGDPPENLRCQIRKMRELTKASFGVNVPLDLPMSGLLINVLLEEHVPVAVTAAGSPKLYSDLLHSEGILVLHVVSSVAHAKSAESCKADAVIAEGAEAAGHIGRDELSLASLIPQVVDAVSVPVIAAGGIADGRGMAAALALGADAVQLGTRFIATEECRAHGNYKSAIVKARAEDTIVTRRSTIPMRSLKNEFTLKLAEMEKAGASADSIQDFIGRGRARRAQIEGDLANGDAYAGSSAGLVREILPAAVVVENLVKGCAEAERRIHRSRIY
jgi:enoyl-[acyl-carrier protein] reductase II